MKDIFKLADIEVHENGNGNEYAAVPVWRKGRVVGWLACVNGHVCLEEHQSIEKTLRLARAQSFEPAHN